MTKITDSETENNLPAGPSTILFYTGSDGRINIDVVIKDETAWMTQKSMAELFGVKIPAISKHLANIFETSELQKKQLFPFWKEFKPRVSDR